jgi:trimethylamine--corrinoid protein Co-methyltransferase
MKEMDVALPQFSLFTREVCERIHNASLEILRKTGVRFFSQEALDLLRKSDAVLIDGDLVKFQPGIVEWALAQAPSRVPLCGRGSAEVVAPLEGRTCCFGTGSDTLTYLDPRTDQIRTWTKADVIDCYHVADALPEIQFCMSSGIPSDSKYNTYRTQFALMLENTTKPIVFVCDDKADCEANIAMAAAAAGGMEALRLNPNLLLYSEPSSPLRQSTTATEKLLLMAETGLPVVHAPGVLMGGTVPVTLAGALALCNAEILSAIVIHQLKRPGAPFVYGPSICPMDMRTSICVYESPERVLQATACAEMGRYYGLPNWGLAGAANSCVFDEQAVAEATFSIFGALISGNNLTHDVGMLDSGTTFSPELVVFSDEAIAMCRQFMAGMVIDSESLALDVIDQVGPGGNFLDADHTVANFRRMWMPTMFNRMPGHQWKAEGSKRSGQLIKEKTISIMETHKPAPLPSAAYDEIERILKTS